MVPGWLRLLAMIYLGTAFAGVLFVLWDIFIARHRQPMKVMDIVWPVTILYFGVPGVLVYWRMARPLSRAPAAEGMASMPPASARPFYQKVFVSTTHCGCGCTLGDIIGEQIVHGFALTVFGLGLYASFIIDFALAYLLGEYFQYIAIRPMHRDWTLGKTISEAVKADTLSLAAFEVGLFGWMALMRFVLFDPPLHPNQSTFWFMMQVGMLVGFATSYPANWYLVRKGIKTMM